MIGEVYARAIFSLITTQKTGESFIEKSRFLLENQSIYSLLVNPSFPINSKKEIIEVFFSLVAGESTEKDVFLFLIEEKRIDCLSEIIRHLQKILDDNLKIKRGTVYVGQQTEQEEIEQAKKMVLNKYFSGWKLNVQQIRKEEIKNGFHLQIEDLFLDITLNKQVQKVIKDI